MQCAREESLVPSLIRLLEVRQADGVKLQQLVLRNSVGLRDKDFYAEDVERLRRLVEKYEEEGATDGDEGFVRPAQENGP